MRRSLVLLLIALLGAVAAPARAQLTTLLDSAATLDPAELEREQSRLLAWLNDPATTITAEQMPQVREHLYFLIGSTAQAHRRATGELFPSAPHADLASLYSYASRLGLYGAGLVARALGDTGGPSSPYYPAPPFGWSLPHPISRCAQTAIGGRFAFLTTSW